MVPTGISRHIDVWLFRMVWKYILPLVAFVLVRVWPNGSIRTVSKSARDIVNAALSDGPEPLSARPKGLYLDGARVGFRNCEARDERKGAMVWRDTLGYVGLREGETGLEDWR